MRILARIAALACAMLLGGCFATSQQLWSLDGGEDLQFEGETFSCTFFDGSGKPNQEELHVVRNTAGTQVRYEVTPKSRKDGKSIPVTFHHVDGSLYVAAMGSRVSAGLDKMLSFVWIDPGVSITLVTPSEEQIIGAAGNREIKISNFQSVFYGLLTGTAEDQRALVLDLAENLKGASVRFHCRPMNP